MIRLQSEVKRKEGLSIRQRKGLTQLSRAAAQSKLHHRDKTFWANFGLMLQFRGSSEPRRPASREIAETWGSRLARVIAGLEFSLSEGHFLSLFCP